MTEERRSPIAPVRIGAAQVARRYLLVITATLGAAVGLRLLSHRSGEMGAAALSLSDLLVVFGVVLPSATPVIAGLRLQPALGARGLAFPRVFNLGFWLYLAGVLLLVIPAVLHEPGMVRTSWLLSSAYDPATTGPSAYGVLAGVALIAGSLVLTSINVLVSVHALRRRGLTWTQLPLGVWGGYAHSLAALVAAPLMLATVLLAAAERALGLGVILPAMGGDPTLFLHLYWGGMHTLLLSGAVVPVLGLSLEFLAARTEGAAGSAGQRRAFVLFVVLSFAGHGQHLIGSGASALSLLLSSCHALLSLALLFYLLTSALRLGPWWPVEHPRHVGLALAALVLVLVLADLAIASGAMATNLGLDLVLFGRVGRALAVLLVAAGLLLVRCPPLRKDLAAQP